MLSAGSQNKKLRILLIAPNISREMGGEGLKALQIHQELRSRGHEVLQVTHERVKREMDRDFSHLAIEYVYDDLAQIWLHRLRLGPALALHNAWACYRKARSVAMDFRPDIVHFTSPISPVLPYFSWPEQAVVIGPLNGNVAHPPSMRSREPLGKVLGRIALKPLQAILGQLFSGKREATILASGGSRTEQALRLGGVQSSQIIRTLDSGIHDTLFDRQRFRHRDINGRFVFLGRLVRYKACDLAIRAIAMAPDHISLDIIGDGPERPRLERLIQALGVGHRVRLCGWHEPGPRLYDKLGEYRALLMPSLAEANGIVFQEAMVLGLPVICVDWAGPQEILSPEHSIMISPTTENEVVKGFSAAVVRLASDPAYADKLSVNSRRRAEEMGFRWSALLAHWEAIYDHAAQQSPKQVTCSHVL
jgi:glycosyltransferase involved in cell wall biosynthesis